MSVGKLISAWRADPEVGGNVAIWRSLPARPPQWVPLPADLQPELYSALIERGLQALYSHQARAWELLRQGKHVAVVAGTASGKTLCYNLPVLDRLLVDPQARALYLFPTKALAQDQAAGLRNLKPDVAAGIYDGDTPESARPALRQNASVFLSNPDMLHAGILPHHTAWAEFFRHLQFVVIDEMHIYRGVFGSHVANVLRRLRRVARFYGAYPQFILTSATIANPQELAEKLVEAPVALVDEDGSGRGPRHFLIYNPPIVDKELGLRRSALQEAVRLAEDCLRQQVQTIIFGRSRRSVELILTYLRERDATGPLPRREHLGPGEPAAPENIRGYRSGYLPRQRRAVEQGLRQGKVQAVVATTALELGIDIGGLGASILVGYPGTIASVRQQAGRAGRGLEPALAVLVATADPLDQYLVAHPDYFFGSSPEQALINPNNLLILLGHLRCAAFELPFQAGDDFGNLDRELLKDFLAFLAGQGELHLSGQRYYWMADQYPAGGISLRSASADAVLLQVGSNPDDPASEPATVIGEVDQASALWLAHPQAIYLHEGQTFLVEQLDLENKVAALRRLDSDYYTEPRLDTTVNLLEKTQEAQLGDPSASLGKIAQGEVSVTTQVTGFRKVRWHTHENLGFGDLELPPSELQTTAFWLALSETTVASLRDAGLWTNDPNQYGPTWKVQRERARARDGYRCQVCGAPEEGRSHDVHHKIPFRTFSDPIVANQLSNLVTLCHACHRRVETAVRVRSGLGGLSHLLGHLAPLFLMCDPRDLGVHSDPQSPLADGQPAVVLYDLVPAGIGFSQRLYELHGELLRQAYERVSACECTDGCPSCTGPGGEGGQGGKRETLAILQALIQAGQE